MADNVTFQTATLATPPGATVVATDDVGGAHFQRVKLVDGTLDSTTGIPGDATNGLDVDVTRVQGTVTVAGTLTANIGTTGGLALDATLTGGTAKAIVRGGAKGATAAADVTSTASGADHQALDVALRDGSGNLLGVTATPVRVDPTGTTAQPVTDNAGSLTIDAPVGTPVAARLSDGAAFLTTAGGRLAVDASGVAVPVTDNGGSLTVDNGGTFAVQDSQVLTDNGAFVDGTSKLYAAGYIFDEAAGTALTENDVAAARVNANRAQVLVIEDETTRGRRTTVTAANALKVDGSAVTQPVSGTVTATLAATVTEDAPSAGGESSVLIAGVRNDAAAAKTSLDGDFGNIALDSAGRVGITDLGGSISVDDNAGSLTTDTAQLPGALVGGRLDANAGAWLGSTAPTVGAKTSANSVPVVLASDQAAVPVTDNAGSLTVDQATAANLNAQVQGAAAADAPVAGNPLQGGGRASDAIPTAMSADGDAVPSWLDRRGATVARLVDSTGDSAMDDANNALRVNIIAGAGSGGTAMTDDAPFTIATTAFTPAGGIYASTLDLVDDGDGGAFHMTQRRAMHVNLRNNSGTEITSFGGTAAVDKAAYSPSVTQFTPVGGTFRNTPSSLADGEAGAVALTSQRAVYATLVDSVGAEYEKPIPVNEDDPAPATAPFMLSIGGIRHDTPSVITDNDGDYQTLRSDAVGALYVTGAESNHVLVTHDPSVRDALDQLIEAVAEEAENRRLHRNRDTVGAVAFTDIAMTQAGEAIPKQAFANVAASQTDSLLVPGVPGKRLRVAVFRVHAGGTATNVTFNAKSGSAGVAISETFACAANGGHHGAFCQWGHFRDTAPGEALTVTTGAGSTVGIGVVYLELAG